MLQKITRFNDLNESYCLKFKLNIEKKIEFTNSQAKISFLYNYFVKLVYLF